MNKTKIFDCTIRDGSYAVNFKFTCTDIKNIVSRQVKLGVEYIEIGHGQGLNASSPERGESLYSDMEYIDAAMTVAKNSKIGVLANSFFISLSSDRDFFKKDGLTRKFPYFF